jgi:hypothetical protein
LTHSGRRATLAGGLITEPGPGRFACHDLLRVYAVELSGEHDTDASRQQAGARLFDHYLHTAHAAMLIIHASSEPLPLPAPLPGVRLDDLRTAGRALEWLGAEREVLVVAVAEAAWSGFDRQAWMIAAAITAYLERTGYCHEAVAALRIALAAATRLDDERAQAEMRRRLGQVLIVLRDYEGATFGEALHSSGDQAAAMDCWQQALRILSDLRHPYADRVRTMLMPTG